MSANKSTVVQQLIQVNNNECSGVTWVWLCLKSPASQLFVQHLNKSNIWESIKARITDPLWRDYTGVLVGLVGLVLLQLDSPHKDLGCRKPVHMMTLCTYRFMTDTYRHPMTWTRRMAGYCFIAPKCLSKSRLPFPFWETIIALWFFYKWWSWFAGRTPQLCGHEAHFVLKLNIPWIPAIFSLWVT